MTEADRDTPQDSENTNEITNAPQAQQTADEHQYNHVSFDKRRKTQWTQEDKQTCTHCGDTLGNHVDQLSICRTRGQIFTEAIPSIRNQ